MVCTVNNRGRPVVAIFFRRRDLSGTACSVGLCINSQETEALSATMIPRSGKLITTDASSPGPASTFQAEGGRFFPGI